MNDTPPSGWLNRTVIGAGLTSFFADVGYELATSLLPSFLLVLNLSKESAGLALGVIEAASDFLSNAAKLVVGWYSDRVGKRKTLVVTGYVLTGTAFALCAIAVGWPLVLVAKSIAWLGKGIRGPLRNAIITDAVDPAHRGKAFGLHRAGDTAGAVLGPVLAWVILYQLPAEWFPDPSGPHRAAFWFTLVPGLAAAFTFAFLVREKRFTPKPGLRLGASLLAMPTAYRRYLVGIAIFGVGDFSHTLLILVATSTLTPELGLKSAAEIGLLLYAWRNLVQAIAAFPAGWLGDRFGHLRVLVVGYAIAALTMLGFIAVLATDAGMNGWFGMFGMLGIFMAIQESLEPAIVPELVPYKSLHGTAFGVLAVVNGFGDVVASLVVGTLFATVNETAGLAFAGVLMGCGAVWMALYGKEKITR